MTTSTLEAARAYSRAYAHDPTPERKERMIEAQRAYDAERERDREREEAAERRRVRDEITGRIAARLAQPTPELTGDLYLVTQATAEYLMMAPAVAGGWIAVDLDTSGLVASDWPDDRFPDLLADLPPGMREDACGTVSRQRAASWLRETLSRYDVCAYLFEDQIALELEWLDRIEGRTS